MVRKIARGKRNVNGKERVASLIAGVLLFFYAVRKRSGLGLLLGFSGAALIYRAASGHSYLYQWLNINTAIPAPIKISQSVTVACSQDEAYTFWRNFENLPSFMQHVASVQVQDEKNSHWNVHLSPQIALEWDAQITEEQPYKFLSWQTDRNASIQHRGEVRFAPASDHQGTEVTATFVYHPPTGEARQVFAQLHKTITGRQVKNDMQRFQQVVEASETPTSEGQVAERSEQLFVDDVKHTILDNDTV